MSDITHFAKGSLFLWPTACEQHCALLWQSCYIFSNEQRVSHIVHCCETVSLHLLPWPIESEWHYIFCEMQSHHIFCTISASEHIATFLFLCLTLYSSTDCKILFQLMWLWTCIDFRCVKLTHQALILISVCMVVCRSKGILNYLLFLITSMNFSSCSEVNKKALQSMYGSVFCCSAKLMLFQY